MAVHKKTIVLLPLILMFFFTACNGKTLDLTIRFDQVHGLVPGNRVLFGENNIGTVERVFYSDQGVFLVDIAIARNFANAATENTRFFIVADPQNTENKAVALVHIRKGGGLLQNNATIDGTTETAVLFKQLADGIEQGLRAFEEQLKQFSQDVQRIPENETFKELENELRLLTEEMKQSGQATREKIKEEVLPKLKEEMEKLRKQLRELGREAEMKPLDAEFDKIEKI